MKTSEIKAGRTYANGRGEYRKVRALIILYEESFEGEGKRRRKIAEGMTTPRKFASWAREEVK